MENAELGTSMSFPPYRRRSRLRCKTVDTFIHILSHLSASTTTPTSLLNAPENGNGTMRQENEERRPECSGFTDPKDSVPQKEISEVHENIEENGDKGNDFNANEMVQDDIELLMGMEETSTQANDFNKELKIMAELEMVVKGVDDHVWDNDLIPLNSGLGEKHNDRNEIELMDYQEEHVEFLHPDVDTSGTGIASKLLVSGDNNQLASEGFHPPPISASAMGQASASIISTSCFDNESQQQETKLVESVCAVVGSLPSTEEGQLEKEEQYGLKVVEATHISLNPDMNNEALNMSEDGGLMDYTILEDKYEVQNEGNTLDKLFSMKNATNSSNILIEIGDLEEGEISGDFEMDGDSIDISSADTPANLTQNEVLHKDCLEESQETTAKEHGISSAVKLTIDHLLQMTDASRKRKGGPSSEVKDRKKMAGADRKKCTPGPDEEKKDNNKLIDASTNKKRGPDSQRKKAKKKMNSRKKRAQKNRELGVKRMKLPPVQKQKTVTYCRHYLAGRCHEGDKCHFSHDTVPRTKSMPCNHFARHNCMKGDACPYDHELSKYPCNNFASSGFCKRGHTCMFSHQVPANQDSPTPSNVCKQQLVSPLLSGNTKFSTPLNNHGFSSIQKNPLTNSKGIADHMVADTSQKQPTSAPKSVRFINAAKLSPSPSTLKQGTITPNKESLVQHGTLADQSASGSTQSMVEIPNKPLAVVPKGINFLSFGKAPVCSFKSSISENCIKMPQLGNFGLPHQASPSLSKDDSDKVCDGTKQNAPQTDLFSNEILNKVLSVAEGLKSKFEGKASKGDSTKDNSDSKSVQEENKSSNNSLTSSVISIDQPFVSHQSSECLVSGYHKLASRSSQKALLSTLAFAAEHESDIRMKLFAAPSSVCLKENR